MTIERHSIPDGMRLHPLRKQYLTASDVPAVAGVDLYKSALRVYAEKTGLVPDVVENAAMKRGRLFEGAALEYLAEEHPRWKIERPAIFITDDIDRLGCTPDAFITDETGALINCQVKTINRYTFERWNGHAPLGYQLQVVCENMLTGADRGILAVLVVSAYDAELKLFDVPRHEAAEDRIRQIALEFWDRVASGRRPDPDYNKDADFIGRLFPPQPDSATLDLTGDNRIGTLLDSLEAAKAAERAAVAESKAIEAEIIVKLDGAEEAICDGWRITRKPRHVAEHMRKASTSYPIRTTRTSEEQAA
jgi:putative phage-type endonuclease